MIPNENLTDLRFADLVARISHVGLVNVVKTLTTAASVLDELGERGAAQRLRHNLFMNSYYDHPVHQAPNDIDVAACNRAYAYILRERGGKYMKNMTRTTAELIPEAVADDCKS